MKACVPTIAVCGTSAGNYGIVENYFLFLLAFVWFVQSYKKMGCTLSSPTLMLDIS